MNNTITLYAVRLQINNNPPGYHSIWQYNEDAERISKLYPMYKYWVEAIEVNKADVRNNMVKLPDSVGFIDIQRKLRTT